MTEMVAVCEGRADVYRYVVHRPAFGANDTDVHFTSLLKAPGELSELGALPQPAFER